MTAHLYRDQEWYRARVVAAILTAPPAEIREIDTEFAAQLERYRLDIEDAEQACGILIKLIMKAQMRDRDFPSRRAAHCTSAHREDDHGRSW
jgi:hypothetical protein